VKDFTRERERERCRRMILSILGKLSMYTDFCSSLYRRSPSSRRQRKMTRHFAISVWQRFIIVVVFIIRVVVVLIIVATLPSRCNDLFIYLFYSRRHPEEICA
jgi:hypothetical protein